MLGIDAAEWRAHPDVLTDSLWLFDRRDNTGGHAAGLDYHGAFVPQVPRQLMRRFTKPGSWVLDPFAGSGTTLIEARRLGRHSVGVELLPEVAEAATVAIASEPNVNEVVAEVCDADARMPFAVRTALRHAGGRFVDLVILHPPYHDIIKFSDDPACLSNARNEATFLQDLAQVAANCNSVLTPGGHAGLVISDKYAKGEWVPLAHHAMQAVADRTGWILKATIVKDVGTTKGKGKNTNLWRYRAFAHGIYTFAFEYLFLFKKPETHAMPDQLSLFGDVRSAA